MANKGMVKLPMKKPFKPTVQVFNFIGGDADKVRQAAKKVKK